MESRPTTEAPHIPPRRKPIHGFGDVIRWGDFVGRIDAIYADYWSALDSFIVSADWFEQQENPPSTKDQIFYSLIAMDGNGSVLVGEQDIKLDRIGNLPHGR